VPLGPRRSVAELALLLAALAPASWALGQSPVLSGYLFDADALEAAIEQRAPHDSEVVEPAARGDTPADFGLLDQPDGRPRRLIPSRPRAAPARPTEVRRLSFGSLRPRMVLTPVPAPPTVALAPNPAASGPQPVLGLDADWSRPPALVDEPAVPEPAPVAEEPEDTPAPDEPLPEEPLPDEPEPEEFEAPPPPAEPQFAPPAEPTPAPTPDDPPLIPAPEEPTEAPKPEEPTEAPAPKEHAPPADGKIALRDAQGRVEAEGRYVNDQPQGVWTRHYLSETSPVVREVLGAGFAAPLRAELTLDAGVPEGPCTIVDAQGRLVARLELKAGRLHGRCVWHLPDNTLLREAYYRDGRLHGAEQTRARPVAVQWVEGRRLDPYQPAVAAGQPSVSGWVLAAGPVAEHSFDWWGGAWLSRVVDRPTEPLRHGEWTWRYGDGRRQGLGTFEFGREEGYWIVWHPAGGKRTEGSYRHGQPAGHWQRWDEHGQLIAQQTFAAPPGGDVPAIATQGGAGLILRR
jgi:antitoxin component YwqK of YwqJK toxin-antitoxin module